jgi:hypothetical protein
MFGASRRGDFEIFRRYRRSTQRPNEIIRMLLLASGRCRTHQDPETRIHRGFLTDQLATGGRRRSLKGGTPSPLSAMTYAGIVTKL